MSCVTSFKSCCFEGSRKFYAETSEVVPWVGRFSQSSRLIGLLPKSRDKNLEHTHHFFRILAIHGKSCALGTKNERQWCRFERSECTMLFESINRRRDLERYCGGIGHTKLSENVRFLPVSVLQRCSHQLEGSQTNLSWL